MGARHRARPGSIQIMKVQVIPASKLKSKNLRQFVVSTVVHSCIDCTQIDVVPTEILDCFTVDCSSMYRGID